jgi:predicted metal-dependent HD superfamily phosphohydrolase
VATRQQIQQARGRWRDLWRRLCASPPPDERFDQLVTAYSDSGRHYHTFDHVLDCLEMLDRFSHLAIKPDEVEMALWFHDAIYDTHRRDNEEASADWAACVMTQAGVEDSSIEGIRRMIQATCHRTAPATRDEALLLDIDLSILGRNGSEFAEYADQIRREFAWVSDDAFQSARAAVLRSFLDRTQIYLTSELHSRYEQRARENLESALRQCERGGGPLDLEGSKQCSYIDP